MAAKKVKISYNDSRPDVVVKVSPRAQVETERHIGGDWTHMALLSVYHMAWGALRKEDSETPDFETWLDQVDDVEEVEENKADPTPEAQSAETSSS
jgi:hypothetical protein